MAPRERSPPRVREPAYERDVSYAERWNPVAPDIFAVGSFSAFTLLRVVVFTQSCAWDTRVRWRCLLPAASLALHALSSPAPYRVAARRAVAAGRARPLRPAPGHLGARRRRPARAATRTL